MTEGVGIKSGLSVFWDYVLPHLLFRGCVKKKKIWCRLYFWIPFHFLVAFIFWVDHLEWSSGMFILNVLLDHLIYLGSFLQTI